MFFRIGAAIVIIICVVLLVLAFGVSAVKAVDLNHKGLTVAPATQDIVAKSGVVTKKKIEVANNSDRQLSVALQVKEFETTDYTYDFVFKTPVDNWIFLEQNRVILQPKQKTVIDVAINVPKDAAPKSHYFAVFASSDMSTVGFKQTAQVVSLLMIKVDGDWVQSGVIHHEHVPFLNIDSKITYRFDAENTGNVHYNIIVFGQVESLFGVKGKEQGAGHVLIPGARRAVEGAVASPMWPGIYKFTYGYSVGSESREVAKTVYILFVPPWSAVLAVVIMFAGIKMWRRYRHRTAKETE